MITRDTVFVLGAGASQAYGFPSGPALVDRICKRLKDLDSESAKRLAEASRCSTTQLSYFRRQLQQSRMNSIDAFLQRRPTHATLGKAAIAQELMERETESAMYPGRESDWYGALFNQIIPKTPDEFRHNRLKIITFNFDRSFEQALFRSCETMFDLEPMNGVNQPVRMMKMVLSFTFMGNWVPTDYPSMSPSIEGISRRTTQPRSPRMRRS